MNMLKQRRRFSIDGPAENQKLGAADGFRAILVVRTSISAESGVPLSDIWSEGVEVDQAANVEWYDGHKPSLLEYWPCGRVAGHVV